VENSILIKKAEESCRNSYSPYSNFRVGAALLCQDGSVFTGTNVENRSYGLAICAERSAIVSAVSSGKKDFVKLAVYAPDAAYPLSPCGACRQVISEFFKPDALIIFGNEKAGFITAAVSELFPFDGLHELKKQE
jgi:cytidine deaminase